eukprot:CAMPEP_0172493602 /NCGR_PEP_ID=MMETSP1066-20121228/25020_1 /TAXON_ID=671091 /ORGANISM="Coscinodiscus wailesii, Strain CCMP2513" /LENGTH=675 /DNA_ID=CAMNT_0013263825 /DNA_START=123 /DNA_END=2147 /DNA_ORIENTATION=-
MRLPERVQIPLLPLETDIEEPLSRDSSRTHDDQGNTSVLCQEWQTLRDGALSTSSLRDYLGNVLVVGDMDYRDSTDIESLIKRTLPTKAKVPTPCQLINLGKAHPNQSRYKPGDWVEVEGLDMIWRVNMITRVVKRAPDDWDWNAPQNEGKEPNWIFTYNAGSIRNIAEEDLRSPEEGLKTVFGHGPWVWQQWALLKVEDKIRFQEGHQDDFAEKDIQKLAADLWDQWLDHPENIEFKTLFEDERIGDYGRSELETHIQKPFNLIDRITEDCDEWDFMNDENISVFTYLSCLGSGLPTVCLVLVLQIGIPIILVWSVFTKQSLECDDKPLDSEVLKASAMCVAVFSYYLVSVFPNAYTQFYNVSGPADSTFSRILSLRRQLWLNANDTIAQMLGYKLDIYMNASYTCLLSMLNIYILTQTNDALEILLNALAFFFIERIDEDIVRSDWYDPKKNWISAAAVQLVMQTNIDLRSLKSSKIFSEKFAIEQDILEQACDNDPRLFKNRSLAEMDRDNTAFMSDEERIEHMSGAIAERIGINYVVNEYKKPRVYFGIIERFLTPWTTTYPLFERTTSYQTWSRWEKVLYLSTVPNIDEIFSTDDDGAHRLNKDLNMKQDEKREILNLQEDEDSRDWVRFIQHYLNVISFRDMAYAMKPAWEVRNYGSMLFRLIDGFVNW